MKIQNFEKLQAQGIIDEQTVTNIKTAEANRNVSVHWELRTLLYLGVVLLATGLGILIYKNLDSIGHLAIVISIALGSLACLAYAYRQAKNYTNAKVESPSIWYDYVVLLGAMLLITFIGYAQYQFNIFGGRYGMATFVPAVMLFVFAYKFDHLGVLSMAITTLAAWAGISITPLHLLHDNDFSSDQIIIVAILLGAFLIGISYLTKHKNIKAHFAFTYKNFGFHLMMLGLCAAMVIFEPTWFIWFTVVCGLGYFFFKEAEREKSMYFVSMSTLYVFFALCFAMGRLFMVANFLDAWILLSFLYIGAAVGLIIFLMNCNKKLKQDDRL
jgi:uncharacterized membrane-anchored protein